MDERWLSVAQLVVWLLMHLHFLSRPRGNAFLVDGGFGVVVIAMFCLWLVIHGMLYEQTELCSTPVGYCPTISCVSANILFQGYVFMFVVFALAAYANLHHIGRYHGASARGRPRWGGASSLPAIAGCTHSLGRTPAPHKVAPAPSGPEPNAGDDVDWLSWRQWIESTAVLVILGAAAAGVVGATAGTAARTDVYQAFHIGLAAGAAATALYICRAGLNRAAGVICPLTAFRSDAQPLEAAGGWGSEAGGVTGGAARLLTFVPFFSKIITAERLVLVGYLCTAFTGVLPTIATDPNERQELVETMSFLHTAGIVIGVMLMAAGTLHRVTTFLRLVLPTRPAPDGAPQRRSSFLPCTWVPNRLTIGYPEWVAGVAVDTCAFALFAGWLVSFVHATLNRPESPTHKSHFCTLYKSETQCLGSDLDTAALGLDPWPCVWRNASVVNCINPQCNAEPNKTELVSEFWTLMWATSMVTGYQCSPFEELPREPGIGPNVWRDRFWFKTATPPIVSVGDPRYCALCWASSATLTDDGTVQTWCMDAVAPCLATSTKLAGAEQFRAESDAAAGKRSVGAANDEPWATEPEEVFY